MKLAEWQKAQTSWEKVKEQSIIDGEHADLCVEAIKNKIKTLPKEDIKEKNKNGK